MRFVLTFGLGLLAKAVAMLAAYYSEWLLEKLASGSADAFDFLLDLRLFGRHVLRLIVSRLIGQHGQRQVECEEDEYELQMFGAN